MSILRERLLAAEVSVTSPNGPLRLDGNGAGELAVTVPRGALHGWTEAALEREIVGMIESSLQAVRRTFHQLRREVLAPDRSTGSTGRDRGGEPIHDHDVTERHRDGSLAKSRTEEFGDGVNRFSVHGVSSRGYVEVIRDDDHRFRAIVRRGTLGHLREPEIGSEIGSALAAAVASYESGYAAAFRSAFGTSPATSLRGALA